MYELFQKFGECEIRLLMDKFKGTPKGIAFVEYGTIREMKVAIGKKIYHSKLQVSRFFLI